MLFLSSKFIHIFLMLLNGNYCDPVLPVRPCGGTDQRGWQVLTEINNAWSSHWLRFTVLSPISSRFL